MISYATLREKHGLDQHRLPLGSATITFPESDQLPEGQHQHHNPASVLGREQKRDAKAASDSSSYSCSPSVAAEPRGRSCASESSGEYEPSHWWSDHGQERLDEAVAREKKERIRVKYRSRARSRSRGQAKRTKERRARTARSGMHPQQDVIKKFLQQRNAIFPTKVHPLARPRDGRGTSAGTPREAAVPSQKVTCPIRPTHPP